MGELSTVRLTFQVDADFDVDELATSTRELRSELLQLDLDDVQVPPAGPPPKGSKAFDAFTLGQLIAQVAASATSLTAFIGAVKGWLCRGRAAHTIKLEMDGDVLEVNGVSSDEEQRLIDLWVTRHSGSLGKVTDSGGG
jgi:hypothetical protein